MLKCVSACLRMIALGLVLNAGTLLLNSAVSRRLRRRSPLSSGFLIRLSRFLARICRKIAAEELFITDFLHLMRIS